MNLPRKAVYDPNIKGLSLFPILFPGPRLPELLEALYKHVSTHHTKHDHIGDLDQEISIPDLSKDLYELNAYCPACYSPDQEQCSHFEIDVTETKMCIGPGSGCCNNLVGIRGRGHGRRNPDHDQKWGH